MLNGLQLAWNGRLENGKARKALLLNQIGEEGTKTTLSVPVGLRWCSQTHAISYPCLL